MNDALGMNGFEADEKIAGEGPGLALGERSPNQPGGEGLSLGVLHDVVEQPVRLAGGINGHDIGMRQSGQESGFPEKPLGLGGRGEFRTENLDRHLAPEGGIVGQIDHTHPTRGDLADHVVLRFEGGSDPSEKVVHGLECPVPRGIRQGRRLGGQRKVDGHRGALARR